MLARTLAVSLTVSLLAGSPLTAAPFGTLEATFTQPAKQIFADPNGPWIYTTVPSLNSTAIYDTRTMTFVKTVFTGSSPDGLTLSADGTRVYVANSGSDFVGVLNTVTQTALPQVMVGINSNRILTGNNNRLFILGEGKIIQVDATTGASTGNQVGAWEGEFAISPDKSTLVFGNTGLSPGHFDKYDVSTNTITTTGGFWFGGNNRALSMSHEGDRVTYASAALNPSTYNIPVFRTSDLVQLGQFELGGPPELIAWSPDDSEVYVRTTYVNTIYVFDTETFLVKGSFAGPSSALDMTLDGSGKHLFIATDTGLVSYAVPEPASLCLIGMAGMLLCARRRRH